MSAKIPPWRVQAKPGQLLGPGDTHALAEIPGVRVQGQALSVPANAIGVVQKAFERVGRTLHWGGMRRDLLPPALSVEVFREQFQPGLLERMYPYQREAFYASINKPGFGIFAPAGSGKTRTAAASALVYDGPILEVTRGGARAQHVREWARVCKAPAYNLKPKSLQRRKDRWASLEAYLDWCAVERSRPIVICGWEALPRIYPAILELSRSYPLTVIWDELHLGKGHKRWEKVTRQTVDSVGRMAVHEDWERSDNIVGSALRVAEAARRRIGTTASPVKHRVSDLWGQLSLLDPGGWGPFWDWAKRYTLAYQGDYGWVKDNENVSHDKRPHTPELNQRIATMAHFTDKDTVQQALRASLGGETPMRRMVYQVAQEEQDKPTAVKAMMRKAAKKGGSAMLEARLIEAAARKKTWVLTNAEDWLTMGKGKVLLFTSRRRDAEDWARRLRSKFKGTKTREQLQVWCSTGEDSADLREAIRRDYMAHPGPCVLVVTNQAWGESINLQDSDVQVLTCLPWTPGELDQLEGRGVRVGMDRPILIVYPVCENTVDERVSAVLLSKLPDVQATTGDKAAQQLEDDLLGDQDALITDLLASIGVEEP